MNHVEFMRLADGIASSSNCLDRKVGAVLVFGTGGAWLQSVNTPKADDTNRNHAEHKLIKMAVDAGRSLQGATLYVTCRPCAQCTADLAGKGLKAIYYRDAQPEMSHLRLLTRNGVIVDSKWLAGQRDPLIEPSLMQKIQASWLARWSV